MQHEFWVSVQENTQTAEARRTAMQLASRLSFDETEAGNVGLIATEAASNLIKHAAGGEMMIRAVQSGEAAGIEMLAIDKGPGIENIARSFQDGYSTSGTPGTGLGAISRLSSFWDIYSQPKAGTALMTQVWKRNGRRSRPPERYRVGAVAAPKKGEPVSGDAWSFLEHAPTGARLTVADGLGHGLLAADAARAAARVSEEHAGESGSRLMERIHLALKPTRGAAVALADIESGRGVLRYTGIGNITASIVGPTGSVHHLVSHPGTAGHEVRRIAEFQYPWISGSILIMHSDGISSHWSLDRYTGLSSRHPSLIAGVLYRDFGRERDDATIVVLVEGAANPSC